MAILIVIADDHEIFRDGFKAMLNRQTDIKVVGEASNGKELIETVSKLKPDVVITDIKMPVMDGIEATRTIKKKFPNIPVIALSMIDDESFIVDIIEAGASGYLLKNAHKNEIIEAIKAVNQSLVYYCHGTSMKLTKIISNIKLVRKDVAEKNLLTEKEIEVIKLVCEELTNKEIAEKLNVSIRTVENYRDRILEKIGVRNSAGMIVYAIRNKIYSI